VPDNCEVSLRAPDAQDVRDCSLIDMKFRNVMSDILVLSVAKHFKFMTIRPQNHAIRPDRMETDGRVFNQVGEASIVFFNSRDIASDLGSTDNNAFPGPDRGNRNGNMDVSAVLCDSNCFEMVYPFAFAKACKNLRLLFQSVRRNDDCDGLANRFFRLLSEKPLRTRIPGLDDAVQVLADDCIVGRFNNRSKL